MTRQELLDRYGQVRRISALHNTAATKYAASPTVRDRAKRLGLGNGRFIYDLTSEEEALIGDLVLYGRVEGRSRAIDRYAHSAWLDPESDEGRTLEAMRKARFSVWRVQRRHETAGLVLLDTARDTEAWLMDVNFESSATPGVAVAGRLFDMDGFAMSCGVLVPVNADVVKEALFNIAVPAEDPGAMMDDLRTAAAIYRAAIASGVMNQIRYRAVTEASQAA